MDTEMVTGYVDVDASEVSRSLTGIDVGPLPSARTLLQSLAQLRTALDSAGEAVFITDTTGRILYVNQAFEHLNGYSREEVLGQNPRILKSGAHDDAFYSALWRTVLGRNIWRGGLVNRRKDGSHYHVEQTIAPVLDPAQGADILGFVSIARDVTERDRMVQALNDSSAQLRAIVESAAEGIITIDEDGRIDLFNLAAERILGYSADEVIGRSVALLLPSPYYEEPEETVVRFLRTGLSAWSGGSRELLARRRDGSNVPIDLAVSEFFRGDRRFFTGIVRDVTNRHVRQQLIEEVKAQRLKFETARSIQQKLFPARPPSVRGLDIAGMSQPAEETGGDYFDFLPLDDGGIALVVADVSGHGIGPALVMAETRAYLRALLHADSYLGSVLTRLNRILEDDVKGEQFVTLFLARFDPRNNGLRYASCGHIAHVIDASGAVSTLDATCCPLGLIPDEIVYEAPPQTLRPGDVLLLMTDGITDVPPDNPFGFDNALEIVRQNRHRSAREIIDALVQAVLRHTGDAPPADDITVVVAKVEAPERA